MCKEYNIIFIFVMDQNKNNKKFKFNLIKFKILCSSTSYRERKELEDQNTIL